jgi:hypothetical protein
LWDNNSLRQSSYYSFEPAFEIADCIDDYDALIQEVTTLEEEARSDRTSKWYEVVYGTSFGLNQAYWTKGIDQVVDLVNKRGVTQLHKKRALDKTKDFAAAVDRLVDGDSQGDLQEINAIINAIINSAVTRSVDSISRSDGASTIAHGVTRACQKVCQSSYNDNTQCS